MTTTTDSLQTQNQEVPHIFSGNVFIFHAFDIGEEVNLEKVKIAGTITPRPLTLSKYFKNYHIPVSFW